MSKIIFLQPKEHHHLPYKDNIDFGQLTNYASEMKQILFLIEQSLEKTARHDCEDIDR